MATFPSKANYVTGEVLTATNMNEIGQAINLLESAQFAAGKNKVINGDFGVWQRGTSFTNTTQYTADRWYANSLYTGDTITQQTFTPGTAPVAGYEGTFYARFVTSASAGTRYFQQRIEDVRTFAGQTVTFSFWAKASAGTTMVSSIGGQNFGSGGSSFVNPTNQTNTLTTSWQRFTQTAAVPSIAGKTIGTSSYLEASFTITTVSTTFEIWGVQLEAASTASNFQTATGTKQGELAACQRYYWRSSGNAAGVMYGVGISATTTAANICVVNPVTMRVAPTSVDFSTLGVGDTIGYNLAVSALTINHAGITSNYLTATNATGATAQRTAFLQNKDSTAGYLGLSAEL
jgi:hypothetical protein